MGDGRKMSGMVGSEPSDDEKSTSMIIFRNWDFVATASKHSIRAELFLARSRGDMGFRISIGLLDKARRRGFFCTGRKKLKVRARSKG